MIAPETTHRAGKRDWRAILTAALRNQLSQAEVARAVGVSRAAVYEQCLRHQVSLPDKRGGSRKDFDEEDKALLSALDEGDFS